MTKLRRVFGPPGCGKTTWLARQAHNAADRYGPSAVVIASLTRGAAAEISSRIVGIPPAHIGTLHALAYRSLERPPLAETTDGLRLWNETAPPNLRLSGNGVRDPEADTSDVGPLEGAGADRLLAEYALLRTSDRPRDSWPAPILRFAHPWEEWKRRVGYLDFCDLIEEAIRRTEHAPGDPAVIMIDEAQDVSAAEMRLVDYWSSRAAELVIVGDPDQNLYEWRGSDPNVFARGDAASEHVLSQSFRVPAKPHAYAVAWIDRVAERRRVEYLPVPDVDGVLERYPARFDDEASVARLARRVADADGTSMVLASCAFMLAPLLKALRLEGVPFHNPYRTTRGDWNPLRGSNRVLALLRNDEDVYGDAARAWSWADVWKWVEPVAAANLNAGAKAFLERKAGKDDFGSTKAADEPADPNLLLELMGEPLVAAAASGDVEAWLDLCLASWKPRLAYSVTVAAKRGGAELLRDPKVVVGTIHSVKGGEADDVYVFPDLSDAALAEWTSGETRRAPLRRLYYVAFTRCRRGLYLCSPTTNRAIRFPDIT